MQLSIGAARPGDRRGDRQAPAPVRRYADVVHHVVKTMDLLGFGGNRTIAATLARAGWRIAKDTVARYRKEPLSPVPWPEQTPEPEGHALRPKFTHHIWFFDLTRVAGLFGAAWFHVAMIFDGFSRMPLLVRVFESEPLPKSLRLLSRRLVPSTARPAIWFPTGVAVHRRGIPADPRRIEGKPPCVRARRRSFSRRPPRPRGKQPRARQHPYDAPA